MFALHDILIEKYIDVFALTETKIDSSFPNAQFSVENFTIHRNDRNSHGGGIICYVRSDIPHRQRHDIENKIMLNQGTEMLVIEMQIYRQVKWFLNVLYKPPKVKDGPFKRCFTDLCNALIKESPHWLFIGDTNFNMLTKNILSELCDIYSLRNVISGPTCHKGDIPTALDVMLLAEPLRFKNPLNVNCSHMYCHKAPASSYSTQKNILSKLPEVWRKYFHKWPGLYTSLCLWCIWWPGW